MTAPLPPGAAGEPRYAGLWPRLLATLLDNAICLVVLLIVAGLIPMDVYEDQEDLATLLAIVLFTAWFNYFAIAEWRFGKTIGKASLRIEVRSESGEPLTWNAAAIRNLMRIVDVLVIGPVLIATSSTRQRLGDRFGKTFVVRSEPAIAARPRTGPPPFFAVLAPQAARAMPAGRADLSALPPPRAPGVDLSTLPPPPPPPTDDELAALPPPPPPGPALASLPPPEPATAGGAPLPKREEGVGIPAPNWSIRELLLSIPILIGGLILVGVAIAIIDPDAESHAALIVGQALFALVLGGIAIGFSSQGPGGMREALARLGLRPFRLSGLGLAAAAYVAYILFVAMVYAPFVQPEQQDIPEELGVDESTIAAIIGGILIIVFAPISEEMFFRGFVYGGLRTRMGLWPAAAISAVVFGLPHVSSADLSIVPPLVIFGLLLAWLYEYTGSLGPPMVLHAINNAIAFTVITAG